MGNAILSYCESEINQKLNFIAIPSRYFIFSNENMYSIKAKGEPLIGYPNFLGGSNLGGNLGDNNEK